MFKTILVSGAVIVATAGGCSGQAEPQTACSPGGRVVDSAKKGEVVDREFYKAAEGHCGARAYLKIDQDGTPPTVWIRVKGKDAERCEPGDRWPSCKKS